MPIDPTSKSGIAVVTGGFLLLVGLLIGTFGAPTDVLFGDDPVVVMEPYDGPNGDRYVTFEDDDQLRVDISERGLNPGARTTIAQLFTITNEDDKDVSIWLSHDSTDAVRFYNDETGARLDSEEHEVLLKPGDRLVVSMQFDTSDAVPGDDLLTTVTLNARFEPDLPFFEVRDLDAPDSVVAGEPLSVDVDLENTGDAAGEQEVAFLVNETVVDSRVVELDVNESESMSFEYETSENDTGTLDVAVVTDDDSKSRTVTVVRDAYFDVTLGDLPDSITTADTLGVEVTVENLGVESDAQSIELLADGTVVDTSTVELDGGSTETVTLEWSPDDDDVGEDVPIAVRSNDDEDTDTVSVTPTVVAEGSASSYVVGVGSSVELRASRSNYPSGSDPNYVWTIDGESIDDTNETVETNFDEPGEYTVGLDVSAAGITDTDVFTITVEDSTDPTARLSADESVELGESITLDASASTDDVAIESYDWDFGDGGTENGTDLTTPTHTYDEPGRYQVTVTVTDTSGNVDTTRARVDVLGPEGSVSPAEVAFGEVGVGSTDSRSIEVSNDGTADLDLSDIGISGDDAADFSLFGEAASGSLTVRPGETRSIGIEFEPQATGEVSASLDLPSNDPDAVDAISLTGTGTEGTIDPVESTIEYGDVSVGSSDSATVTFENTGDGPIELTAIAVSGDDEGMFEVNDGDDLPIELDPGQQHTFTVDFSPSRSGALSASLHVTAGDETASASLRGTGRAPSIHLSPDDLEFPTIGVGDRTEETLTVTNYGNDDLDVQSVSVTGPDAEHFDIRTDDLPDTIAPDESATFELDFSPLADGDHEASLEIESNDPDAPTLEVSVVGPAVGADIGIDRRTVDFGNVTIGETVYMPITVRNKEDSPADLRINETQIVSDDDDAFRVNAGDAPIELAPGESHAIEIAFRPQTEGTKDAQLQILSDAGNHPLINVWLSNTRTYILVQEISNPTVGVEGRNLAVDGVHDVNVWAPSVEDEPAGFSEIEFTTARSGNFDMNIVHDREPRGPAFEDAERAAIEYVELAHFDSDPDETFDNTAISYEVNKENLPSDVGPDDIRLYRWNDDRDEWEDMTDRGELVEETASKYVYHVETPGFSQFTVTAPQVDDDAPPGDGGSGSDPDDDDSGGAPSVGDDGEGPGDEGLGDEGESRMSVEDVSTQDGGRELQVSEVSMETLLEMDEAFEGLPPRALIDSRTLDSDTGPIEQNALDGTVVTVDGEELTVGEDVLVTTTGTTTRLSGSRSLLRTVDAITSTENMVAAADVTTPDGQPDGPITLRFGIDRDRFPEVMPDGVTVGHRTDDGWELLEAEIVDVDDDTVFVDVETDSLSVFAVFVDPQVAYEWELPDGTPRTEASFNHTFEEPGLYPVALTVTDAFDRQNSTTHRVLANDVPTASVADVTEDQLTGNVTFVAEVENEIGNATVTWTFPDGTERVGTEVTHDLAPGEYTVELHVEDDLGASSETAETVTVGPGATSIVAAIEGLDIGLVGVGIAVLAVLLVAATILGVRRFPLAALRTGDERPPVITRVDGVSIDPEKRCLAIDALTVTDPDGTLDRVTFEVTDDDGTEVFRKHLDIDPKTRYAPTDEELVIPFHARIDPARTYRLAVTAHGTNGLVDARSIVDLPVDAPEDGPDDAA